MRFSTTSLSVFLVLSSSKKNLVSSQGQSNLADDCIGRKPIGSIGSSGVRGGTRGQLCNDHTPPSNSNFPSVPLTSIRSIDGSDEDVRGAAGAIFLRLTEANYPDGPSGTTMEEYPNARYISNLVANNNLMDGHHEDNDDGGRRRNMQQHNSNEPPRSDMIWIWGQFVDHDLALTPEQEEHEEEGGEHGETESMVIVSPDCDNGDELCTIAFRRSQYRMDDNEERQQFNTITAFIDASMIYGSDIERSYALREFHFGRLKVSDNDMLPYNTGNRFENAALESNDPEDLCLAGDVRANEQVGLTAIHTLFVREHNRVAHLLFEAYPASRDEHIYQMARKIVGAEIQKITYDEFLPELLGPMFAINLPQAYTGYNPNMNPAVSTEFATVAFRVGHTMLSPTLMRSGDTNNDLSLINAFFNPSIIMNDPSNMDLLFDGFCHQSAQHVDTMIIDEVRNFLFGKSSVSAEDLTCK